MVYKRVRGWTSWLEPPRVNICWVPLPPPRGIGRCFWLKKKDKVKLRVLCCACYITMDSFSCKLTRFRCYIVARQQTLPYKPQNRTCHATFTLPGSRQYGRAKTAVDRRKGERAGIGYSKPCQNIYTRPWLNHYWIWKQKEKQVKARRTQRQRACALECDDSTEKNSSILYQNT